MEEKKSERSLKEKAGLDFPVFLIGSGTAEIELEVKKGVFVVSVLFALIRKPV